MATTPMVLGQVCPAVAGVDNDLYTAPAGTNAIVSAITVANTSVAVGNIDTVRVAVRPAGAAIANQHYLLYDTMLYYAETYQLVAGIALEPTDVITVRSGLANITAFGAYGAELTAPLQAGNPQVLGQQAPGAAVWVNLYTVPALTNTVVSSLVICNRSNVWTTVYVRVRPGGAAFSTRHYLLYQLRLEGNDVYVWTSGIGLAATDVVDVQNTLATCSFSLFGSEIT